MKYQVLIDYYLSLSITPHPEESPDDLQINHQIRVEAHLVA